MMAARREHRNQYYACIIIGIDFAMFILPN